MDQQRQGESRPNLSEVNVVVVDDSTASSGRLLHLHALSIDSASLPNANEQVFIHISHLSLSLSLSLSRSFSAHINVDFWLHTSFSNSCRKTYVCIYKACLSICVWFCFVFLINFMFGVCNGCARFFNMFTYLEFVF